MVDHGAVCSTFFFFSSNTVFASGQLTFADHIFVKPDCFPGVLMGKSCFHRSSRSSSARCSIESMGDSQPRQRDHSLRRGRSTSTPIYRSIKGCGGRCAQFFKLRASLAQFLWNVDHSIASVFFLPFCWLRLILSVIYIFWSWQSARFESCVNELSLHTNSPFLMVSITGNIFQFRFPQHLLRRLCFFGGRMNMNTFPALFPTLSASPLII